MCAEELRRNRRPVVFDAFTITVAVLLVVDVAAIALARLWPETFGVALLVYGLVLFVPGVGGFWFVLQVGHLKDITVWAFLLLSPRKLDWTVARWPVMMALLGLACILAYCSFVMFPKAEQESPMGSSARTMRVANDGSRGSRTLLECQCRRLDPTGAGRL